MEATSILKTTLIFNSYLRLDITSGSFLVLVALFLMFLIKLIYML